MSQYPCPIGIFVKIPQLHFVIGKIFTCSSPSGHAATVRHSLLPLRGAGCTPFEAVPALRSCYYCLKSADCFIFAHPAPSRTHPATGPLPPSPRCYRPRPRHSEPRNQQGVVTPPVRVQLRQFCRPHLMLLTPRHPVQIFCSPRGFAGLPATGGSKSVPLKIWVDLSCHRLEEASTRPPPTSMRYAVISRENQPGKAARQLTFSPVYHIIWQMHYIVNEVLC